MYQRYEESEPVYRAAVGFALLLNIVSSGTSTISPQHRMMRPFKRCCGFSAHNKHTEETLCISLPNQTHTEPHGLSSAPISEHINTPHSPSMLRLRRSGGKRGVNIHRTTTHRRIGHSYGRLNLIECVRALALVACTSYTYTNIMRRSICIRRIRITNTVRAEPLSLSLSGHKIKIRLRRPRQNRYVINCKWKWTLIYRARMASRVWARWVWLCCSIKYLYVAVADRLAWSSFEL